MKHRSILASAAALALISLAASGCSGGGDINMSTAPLAPGSGGSASAAPASAGNQTGASVAGSSGAATGAVGTGAGGTSEAPPVVQPLGAAGMTGGIAAGAQGGSGGAPGAAGAGMTSDPTALCPAGGTSPSNGVACTVTCTDGCGVHNLGARLCSCTNAVFACDPCGYTVDSPLLVPPTTPLPPCPLSDDAQEKDGTGCTDNDRCQSIGKTPGATDGAKRFCGCLMNKWDCDTKPATFG